MSSITDLLSSNGKNVGKAFDNVGNFVLGTVTDNGNKDFPGMVKVQYTGWQDKENISEWLPILQSYASDKYGGYIVPEVKDIVLVGFIGAGMKRPFVLGSMFPANAQFVKDSFVDKNTTRHFKTKAGIDILLSDEKDKEAFTLTTPKGMLVSLADEKEIITVSDKNGDNLIKIDTKNGEMSVTAKQKMVLQAGKCKITLDGNGGGVTIECDKIDLKANQTVGISANQQVNISGGMLKAEGKQTAEVSGGTMTQIKGGMVKIN
ncbi:MAG: phage baseplate assembly protein V [Oscillospiraceae bacterium]